MAEAVLYARMRVVKAWLPVLVWAGVILSAANDSFSDEQSLEWLELLFGPGVPDFLNYLVRKGAHLAEYALLAALAWRAERRPWLPVFVAAAVAIADETIQATTATRSGSPWDVLLDVCGAVIAVVLLGRIARARMSRQEEA
jgi:VanZ family protein